MTVPAFSPSVVLPGAPSAPAAIGASAQAAGQASGLGLFEGLLAGLADAEPAALPGKTRSATDTTDPDQPAQDATTAPQDAGLALLFAAPGAAQVFPVSPKATTDGAAAVDLAARQIRVPVFSLGHDRQAAVVGPTPSPADLAVSSGMPDLDAQTVAAAAATPTPVVPEAPRLDALFKGLANAPGQTVPDVDVKAAPTAPTAPRTVPADLPKAGAAAPPPATAPAPVVSASAEQTAITATAAVVETLTPVQPEAPRAAPTIGDVRRAAVARGDRRVDTAGRLAMTLQAIDSPAKLAAAAALTHDGAADPTDAGAAPDPEQAVTDLAEAPEAQQPSLPSEIRAQTAQAIAVADVAAATRGLPETVAKLAADIIRKLDGQNTRFDIELNPHGMGKVDVAIEIDKAGKLTAAMTFDTAQSAADLRGRASELRLALEQAGFSVSDGGLTFDMAGQGAGFGGRDAAQQQQQDRAWNGRAFQRAQSGADEADLSLAGVSSPSASRTRSGVDIRI